MAAKISLNKISTLSFALAKNCSPTTNLLANQHRWRKISHRALSLSSNRRDGFSPPQPEFDWEYLTHPDNSQAIQQNISTRKGVGNIERVVQLYQNLQQLNKEGKADADVKNQLYAEAAAIPNQSHPNTPIGDESQATLLKTVGQPKEFSFEPLTVGELGEKLGILRMKNTTVASGHKSYYFMDSLAKLESALVQYSLDYLLKKGFSLVTVPNILHSSVIEGCGFQTRGTRTQVYKLDPEMYGDACLAGTGEMPLAGYFMNEVLDCDSLPKKLCAVSPCYRAEASDVDDEKGIYRVHQFKKVEMFGVSRADESSEQLMQEFAQIQEELFTQLGLYFRILDMPSEELGAPAYRKYDMETWMPARGFWGEISSTSHCADYQSRRLAIKYTDTDGNNKHAHTVNGTACAVPRLIMALLESNQQQDGSIQIPSILQPYMGGMDVLEPSTLPDMQWIRLTKNLRNKTKQKQH